MQENSAQQLSALTDDELTDFERRRLLSDLLGDAQNRATLARYQLIGEAMRHEASEALVAPGFHTRVAQAIEQEATPTPVGAPVAWRKPLAGVAMAASVALFSFWMVPQLMQSAAPERVEASVAVQQASPSAPVLLAQTTPIQEPEWQTLPAEMEEKLNRYLVDHAEFAAGKGMDRMLPYASFVSYDSRR